MLNRRGNEEAEQEDCFAGVVRVGNLSLDEKETFALQLHAPVRPNPRYKPPRFCFGHLDSRTHRPVSPEVLLVLPDNLGQ